MKVGLLRAVGVATAVYGAAVAAVPDLLARPSGLADEEGRTGRATRTSLRPLAWRDAVSGLAMAMAPDGPALRTAAYVRIAADFGDAVLLGATLPGHRQRAPPDGHHHRRRPPLAGRPRPGGRREVRHPRAAGPLRG
ncbi:hypothetical protein [Streptomyces sp. WAC01526]|uniref:hypothetical protein n=1 Tax=Streptomyces sp. WAC01526 TaxID=2588709 RepID=UPI0011DF9C97|nr:hypothetical protein [Streptomyces sp. WAC01526]